MTIRILDLFCGAGLAAQGYDRAFTSLGYDVEITGIDKYPQPRYPYIFKQTEALDYLCRCGHRYDFIHASPPCPHYSTATYISQTRHNHPDLIPITRALLRFVGVPYIIENVEGARLVMRNPIVLCGAYFGLKVYRHRLFESSMFLLGIPHSPHRDKTPTAGGGRSPKGFISITSGGIRGVTPEERRAAMGVDRYVTNTELNDAFPPAYTEFLGRQVADYIRRREDVA